MKFLTITALLVGIAGAFLLSWGAWLIYPPIGYICAGLLCLLWSYLVSRALGQPRNNKEE
ncbi:MULTISPECIES: hypothetical protein [Proteus]|uniref:hypothetical protein n=1 Tax=Proteus TaxID=583 RepID=UPI000D69A234|nr:MULTISPECIES: hypothetical protein [Proteus]MBG3150501.1 hypothetical protein [Proteus mirabilis]MBI6340168.1 hypothetical protein [Proteus sp. PR00224]MBI6510597.1 hypothetical protein [Proteus sp. PR00174]MDS0789089.1 hypothetical protein [Proteus vulgaris]NBM68775.1 hypothetical protein [Proteus sp. G2663]